MKNPSLNTNFDKSNVDGLAVDFGGTKTSAARIVNGRVIKHVELKTAGMADIDAQINAITNLLDQLSISSEDKLGFAVTGRITDGIWHALNKKTLTEINMVPLHKILVEKFQREVFILNDAQAATIGEHAIGAAKQFSSAAYVTISTGVGGGLIINNQPVISADGLAGHFGFSTSRMNGGKCGSGRFDTFESIASGNALVKFAEQAGRNGYDGKAVFDAHLSGEGWATKIIENSARAIAELCVNLKVMLGLEVIILGGSIGLAQGYLNLVEQYISKESDSFRIKIKPSILGENAALLGILYAQIQIRK